jgi:hypothetical protein
MPSLTQWLQRFVDEVRTPDPAASGLSPLDQSLAAAFVTLPAERQASPALDIAGDPLFGPALATPPRPANPAPAWLTPARRTPAQAGPVWERPAARQNTAAGPAGAAFGWSERPTREALAALDAAFGNPRSPVGAPPPGTPAREWTTTSRPAPRTDGTATPPAVPVASPDHSPDHSPAAWPVSPTQSGTTPAPNTSASPNPAVLPLAELLRDLVPASPFEARLESLWQQRSGALSGGAFPGAGGMSAAPWPDSPWSQAPGIVPGQPPAVDWSDLARRLADLEAGQGGA